MFTMSTLGRFESIGSILGRSFMNALTAARLLVGSGRDGTEPVWLARAHGGTRPRPKADGAKPISPLQGEKYKACRSLWAAYPRIHCPAERGFATVLSRSPCYRRLSSGVFRWGA